MINVLVRYKVRPDFAQKNKANIQNFLRDFEALDQENFKYSVFVKDDGVTFLHQSLYKNKRVQDELLNVPSFLEFQKARDESGLDGSHEVQVLSFVGSSGNLINV